MQLLARQPDGSTLRDHLVAANADDERLARPCPKAGASLWAAFVDLSGSRPAGMNGMAAIPPTEIDAWCRLHGVRLSSWEVETLQMMDRAAVAKHNQGIKR